MSSSARRSGRGCRASILDHVDVCVTCVSDKPPVLPLREELPSLGVEVIYRSRGKGVNVAKREMRQAVQSFRQEQATRDLAEAPMKSPSWESIQATLAERKRIETILKSTPKALSYESYANSKYRSGSPSTEGSSQGSGCEQDQDGRYDGCDEYDDFISSEEREEPTKIPSAPRKIFEEPLPPKISLKDLVIRDAEEKKRASSPTGRARDLAENRRSENPPARQRTLRSTKEPDFERETQGNDALVSPPVIRRKTIASLDLQQTETKDSKLKEADQKEKPRVESRHMSSTPTLQEEECNLLQELFHPEGQNGRQELEVYDEGLVPLVRGVEVANINATMEYLTGKDKHVVGGAEVEDPGDNLFVTGVLSDLTSYDEESIADGESCSLNTPMPLDPVLGPGEVHRSPQDLVDHPLLPPKTQQSGTTPSGVSVASSRTAWEERSKQDHSLSPSRKPKVSLQQLIANDLPDSDNGQKEHDDHPDDEAPPSSSSSLVSRGKRFASRVKEVKATSDRPKNVSQALDFLEKQKHQSTKPVQQPETPTPLSETLLAMDQHHSYHRAKSSFSVAKKYPQSSSTNKSKAPKQPAKRNSVLQALRQSDKSAELSRSASPSIKDRAHRFNRMVGVMSSPPTKQPEKHFDSFDDKSENRCSSPSVKDRVSRFNAKVSPRTSFASTKLETSVAVDDKRESRSTSPSVKDRVSRFNAKKVSYLPTHLPGRQHEKSTDDKSESRSTSPSVKDRVNRFNAKGSDRQMEKGSALDVMSESRSTSPCVKDRVNRLNVKGGKHSLPNPQLENRALLVGTSSLDEKSEGRDTSPSVKDRVNRFNVKGKKPIIPNTQLNKGFIPNVQLTLDEISEGRAASPSVKDRVNRFNSKSSSPRLPCCHVSKASQDKRCMERSFRGRAFTKEVMEGLVMPSLTDRGSNVNSGNLIENSLDGPEDNLVAAKSWQPKSKDFTELPSLPAETTAKSSQKNPPPASNSDSANTGTSSLDNGTSNENDLCVVTGTKGAGSCPSPPIVVLPSKQSTEPAASAQQASNTSRLSVTSHKPEGRSAPTAGPISTVPTVLPEAKVNSLDGPEDNPGAAKSWLPKSKPPSLPAKTTTKSPQKNPPSASNSDSANTGTSSLDKGTSNENDVNAAADTEGAESCPGTTVVVLPSKQSTEPAAVSAQQASNPLGPSITSHKEGRSAPAAGPISTLPTVVLEANVNSGNPIENSLDGPGDNLVAAKSWQPKSKDQCQPPSLPAKKTTESPQKHPLPASNSDSAKTGTSSLDKGTSNENDENAVTGTEGAESCSGTTVVVFPSKQSTEPAASAQHASNTLRGSCTSYEAEARSAPAAGPISTAPTAVPEANVNSANSIENSLEGPEDNPVAGESWQPKSKDLCQPPSLPAKKTTESPQEHPLPASSSDSANTGTSSLDKGTSNESDVNAVTGIEGAESCPGPTVVVLPSKQSTERAAASAQQASNPLGPSSTSHTAEARSAPAAGPITTVPTVVPEAVTASAADPITTVPTAVPETRSAPAACPIPTVSTAGLIEQKDDDAAVTNQEEKPLDQPSATASSSITIAAVRSRPQPGSTCRRFREPPAFLKTSLQTNSSSRQVAPPSPRKSQGRVSELAKKFTKP